MKKKLIGLSILLLVLLLGLSTNSYAKISQVEIKNICTSALVNSGWTIENAMAKVDLINNDQTYIDNPSYNIIAYKDGNDLRIIFYVGINNGGYSYRTNYSSTKWRIFSFQSRYQIVLNMSLNSGNFQYISVSNSSYDFTTLKSPLFLYCQDTIYTDSNHTTIAWNSGYKSNISLDGYYSSAATWGVKEHLYDEVTVQGWNVQAYINSIYQSYFDGYGTSALEDGWSTALFGGLDEYLSAEVDLYRFDRQSNTWYKSMSTSDRVKIYGQDTESNTFYLYLGITPYWSDSVAILTLHHKTNPLLDYQVLLYLMSDSTVIDRNGYISMTGTINNYNYSGDNGYVNNSNTINNQNDTQSIVDTLTDDSQVDGMLSEFTNGDSDDMANKLGYTPFANPFTSFLQNIFNGIIDALLNDQDVQLNFGFGGKNYYVSSADFTTPENNTFINLAKWALIFAYIYGVYRFGWLKIQKLSEFDLDKSGSYTTSERPGRITYGEEELPFDML